MKNEKVIFNVIMPCYNSEKYVVTALESIVGQTYPQWRLIAVNDGSTDKTLDILNEYAEKDERIKVFSKENGGYVSAVNYGLDHLDGDYFMFLGSDDYLSKDLFFELQRNIMDLPILPDCIAFKTNKVCGDTFKADPYTNFNELFFEKDTTLKNYAEKKPTYSDIFFTRDTSKCFKCSLLGEQRYFGKYGIDADGIFSMLLCNKAESFLNVPCVGYYWTIREDSVSSTKTITVEKEIDRLENWQKFYAELDKIDVSEIPQIEVNYLYTVQDIICHLMEDLDIAIKYSDFLKKHIKWRIKIEKRFSYKLLKIKHYLLYFLFYFSPVLTVNVLKFYRKLKRK